MTQPKKLIEVAMPIKEISAESVRDKSIRHGHISTLHLWWARRPLPVCRAVVFASLVPDPLDPNCPSVFKEAVQLLLGKANNPGDPYKPYDDIPYTAVIDPMEDNGRNRLMMYIGKFSETFIKNEHLGKTTNAKDNLSHASLIKWDNKNDEKIIGIARKLIWVAHNAASEKTANELIADFDTHYKAIKDAEQDLYSTPDRNNATDTIKAKEAKLHNAIEAFLDKMPKVFDPFAGGGAIPLEAARLGCRSYGNDINPVAHIIQKGSLEFPQKYGKPITYSKREFEELYGEEELKKVPNDWKGFTGNSQWTFVIVPNRLSFDVEFYAKKLLTETEKEVGQLYPPDEKGNKPIAYYWARVGTCSNPSCKAKVPLLRQMNLAKKTNKSIQLQPIIDGNKIDFKVVHGSLSNESWISGGNMICPCCGNTTDNSTLKKQFYKGEIEERLLALIYDIGDGKSYYLPDYENLKVFEEFPSVRYRPNERLPITYSKAMAFCLWNYNSWGDIFSHRELLLLNALSEQLNQLIINAESEYKLAIKTYLAIFFNRVLSRETTFGLWNTIGEKIEHPFGKSAIQMVFDYPESNPFALTGGGAMNQLSWIIKYIESEANFFNYTYCVNASSGDKNQFESNYLDSVITDPPYYDAVAYADLSDFFYIWLKKTLINDYPLLFMTPQTPKTEECTALKHHHQEDMQKAKTHFENKLRQIFSVIQLQTKDTVSIMYAHQSTEAWTTLCNSILGANMNITGSWAIDTERSSAGLKKAQAFLSSSVTVSCRPSQKSGFGDYKEVKIAVGNTVVKEVEELYRLGFRGADLLTACFGQAVSEFGKYEKVEKADGSEVTVAELLEMAKESAFDALLKGFVGDDFTKFYIGWLQLYGFTQSEFDDAAKFARIGLSINVQELFMEHILIKSGNKQTLGGFQERIKENKNIGERANNLLIDQVHRAMALYKGTNRTALLQYIGKVASSPESSFWRVVTSLCEVLPAGSEDLKQATGILSNKDSLIRDSKTIITQTTEQTRLFE
jgi:adenine-specific DNA methylase